MNEHKNVNKNTKRLSVSRDTFYGLNPTNSFLNNHVTVHIQSKVFI